MHARFALVAMGLIAASPIMAEPLNPDAARAFISGKLFSYNCFDGTRGVGRIYNDGSVAGSKWASGAEAISRHMRHSARTVRSARRSSSDIFKCCATRGPDARYPEEIVCIRRIRA